MGKERIHSLDFLRGAAVLGMLVANIPWHAGDSMSRVLDPDAASVSAWMVQYLVFDQRFMPIFAMLFGSGLLLMHDPDEPLARFGPYYLKRMAILLCFGIAHAYLLWPGDILITYAVCGPFLLLALHLRPSRLILIGILFKAFDLAISQWPAIYDLSIGATLFDWWVDYGEPPMTIGEAYAGNYTDLLAYNAWRNQFIQWTGLTSFRVWNAQGFMLIGMGLFKLGIVQGSMPTHFYRRTVVFSLIVGGPLVIYGVLARIGENPTVGPFLGFVSELPLPSATFLAGAAITSLAMLGGLHLLRPRLPEWWRESVECVGRMALTNYITQSALFLVLFHVSKALPFDSLDHDWLLGLVLGTWIIQIAMSRIWLSHFRQGPLEWLWRRASGANPTRRSLAVSADVR